MEKEETASEMLQRLGMDGGLWAEEMHKRFPAIAEDDLLGWCCNMIMAGYDEAERRARKRESVSDEAFLELANVYNWAHSKGYYSRNAENIIIANGYMVVTNQSRRG